MNLGDDLVHGAHGIETDGAFIHHGGRFIVIRIGAAAGHLLEAAQAHIASGKRRGRIAHGAQLHLVLHLGAFELSQAHLAKLFVLLNVIQFAAGAFDEFHLSVPPL